VDRIENLAKHLGGAGQAHRVCARSIRIPLFSSDDRRATSSSRMLKFSIILCR
jgi:hypothetical protein